MPNTFANGKRAIAECDRCGFRFRLNQLRTLVIKTKNINIKVCDACWEPDHPQLQLGMYPISDPQALRDPRTDRAEFAQERAAIVPVTSYLSGIERTFGLGQVGFVNVTGAATTPVYGASASGYVGDVRVDITDPPIGAAFGGGFYAGKIVQGGTTYLLIVAPLPEGLNGIGLLWNSSGGAGPAATRTLNNGPAASASMISGSYPAAQFCEGLTINGYSDWYLPSRDELELCYRNLKPKTTANNVSARAKSAYVYPEGNDEVGDTQGINRNSSPTGAAYTASIPQQTSAVAFRVGGAQAFGAGSSYYWTSSEFSSTLAWFYSFEDGTVGVTTKNFASALYVRAVRRVAV